MLHMRHFQREYEQPGVFAKCLAGHLLLQSASGRNRNSSVREVNFRKYGHRRIKGSIQRKKESSTDSPSSSA